MVLLAFMITIVFITAHISTTYLKVLDKIPRSRFLSASGGVAVSYVFIHVLPELSENQDRVTGDIYVIALLGLVTFYGLEKMSKISKRNNPKRDTASEGVFWIHLSSTALYDAVTGYLLLNREQDTIRSLIFYGIAIGLHFVVVDHGLRVYYKELYDKYGRWVLAAGSIIGFLIGYTMKVNEIAVSVLFAFLAGGIILNILKEELPEERQSSFIAFLAGVVGYSTLLLFT